MYKASKAKMSKQKNERSITFFIGFSHFEGIFPKTPKVLFCLTAPEPFTYKAIEGFRSDTS